VHGPECYNSLKSVQPVRVLATAALYLGPYTSRVSHATASRMSRATARVDKAANNIGLGTVLICYQNPDRFVIALAHHDGYPRPPNRYNSDGMQVHTYYSNTSIVKLRRININNK